MQNFTGNPQWEAFLIGQLVPGEEAVAVISTPERTISLTSRRILLHEKGGNFSAIRIASISAIEVTKGRGTEQYLAIHFGGTLSRTVMVSDPAQAQAIFAVSGQA